MKKEKVVEAVLVLKSLYDNLTEYERGYRAACEAFLEVLDLLEQTKPSRQDYFKKYYVKNSDRIKLREINKAAAANSKI